MWLKLKMPSDKDIYIYNYNNANYQFQEQETRSQRGAKSLQQKATPVRQESNSFYAFTVKFRKPLTPKILMECLCHMERANKTRKTMVDQKQQW